MALTLNTYINMFEINSPCIFCDNNLMGDSGDNFPCLFPNDGWTGLTSYFPPPRASVQKAN